MANYRVKEKNGLFTIEVELTKNWNALRFKNEFVQCDLYGKPISKFDIIEYKTYLTLSEALTDAYYFKNESEKKKEEIKYHYLN